MAEIIPLQGELLPTAEAVEHFCIAQAEAIRVLGKRMITDIIEIGQRLTAVKQAQPRGAWLKWLKREFDWTDRTATNYMRIAEVFGSKSENFSDLEISPSALLQLAGPEVGEEIRDKAIGRAQQGERITLAKAREMVAGEVSEEIASAVQQVRDSAEQKAAAAAAAATERLAQLTARLSDASAKSVELSTALEQLRAGREQEVADARAAVEAKYADKLVVSEDELKEQVAALMAPSEKQITRLEGLLEREQAKRERVEGRLQALRDSQREQHPPAPPFDSDLSMKAMVLRQAVQNMRAEIKHSAAEHIAIELEFSTRFHNRPELAHQRLTAMAATIREDLMPWFQEFLRLYPGGNHEG
jgi:hypothetical protein